MTIGNVEVNGLDPNTTETTTKATRAPSLSASTGNAIGNTLSNMLSAITLEMPLIEPLTDTDNSKEYSFETNQVSEIPLTLKDTVAA